MPKSRKMVPRPHKRRRVEKGKKKDAEEIVEKQFSVADVLQLVRIKMQKMINDQPPVEFDTKIQETTEENKADQVDAKTKNLNLTYNMMKDYKPHPPFPPLDCTKLVFMDNLHPDIKESDVVDFFKDDGKIDRVTFLDTKIFGCGDVRFETYEAAEKALKRDGEVLIDRPVRLFASDERTIFDFYTPTTEQKYLFMGNLSLSVEEKDVVEFFKDDGEIVSVRLMSEDYPFVADKLVAHVEFTSSTVAYKALQRYGLSLRGCRVELALATEKSVWYSSTPSSSKPPRGPGWGPPSCSRCKKDLVM